MIRQAMTTALGAHGLPAVRRAQAGFGLGRAEHPLGEKEMPELSIRRADAAVPFRKLRTAPVRHPPFSG